MASSEKIEKELEIALKEIGVIKPWFDKDVNAWIFEHELYPVESSGDSPEVVCQNYPLYMKDFITERLNNNLSPVTERKTRGHAGSVR